MKTNHLRILGIAVAMVCGNLSAPAQTMPEMPKPQKEHEWLKKFEGEWELKSQMLMDPSKPIESKGTETVRTMGGFWVTAEGKGEMMGSTMSYLMTLGYDPAKKKYVATMIDSMTGRMWQYTGSLNEAGTTLTLETEGPCPMRGGKLTEFKDITEFKSDNQRVFTSMYKDEKGEWVTVFKGEATRTK